MFAGGIMPRTKKPADLPMLEPEDAAIVVGYDLDEMVRQRYCEWCLFWDFNQALETSIFPESARLVLINGALGSSGEKLKNIFEQKGLKVQVVSSGVPAIQSLMEKLFGPNISKGNRGPFMRRVIAEPEPDAELVPIEAMKREPTRPAPDIKNSGQGLPVKSKDNAGDLETVTHSDEEWQERLGDALTAQKNVEKTSDQDK